MFKLANGVLDFYINQSHVGYAIAVYNENLITIDILTYNNDYIKNNFAIISEVLTGVATIDNAKVLLLRTLERSDNKLELVIKERRTNYISDINSKKIYVTKDFGHFGNKIFVNINNESYMDYDINVDLNYIFNEVKNFITT